MLPVTHIVRCSCLKTVAKIRKIVVELKFIVGQMLLFQIVTQILKNKRVL